MSRPRFLADHNFNDDIIEGLSRLEPLFEVRQSFPVGRVIQHLLAIWEATEAEEWPDKVLFLPI